VWRSSQKGLDQNRLQRIKTGHSRIRQLKQLRVPLPTKFQNKYPLPGQYKGRIAQLDTHNYYIEREGDGAWIYGRRDTVPPAVWAKLMTGSLVKFGVTFNLTGPSAFDLELV